MEVNEVAGHRNPILALTKDDRNSQHDDCAPRRFSARAHVGRGVARPRRPSRRHRRRSPVGPRRGLGAAAGLPRGDAQGLRQGRARALRRVLRGADEEGRRPGPPLAFARRTGNQGYLRDFRDTGQGRHGPRRIPLPRQREPGVLPGQRRSPDDRRGRSAVDHEGDAGGQPGLRRPAQALSEPRDLPGHALRRDRARRREPEERRPAVRPRFPAARRLPRLHDRGLGEGRLRLRRQRQVRRDRRSAASGRGAETRR